MRSLTNREWQPVLDALWRSSDRLAASGCTLATCSGNHDSWASLGKVPWHASLRPGFIGDALQPFRASHIVEVGDESAIVTCFPWRNDDGDDSSLSSLLDYAGAGKKLRDQNPNSLWVWLHHGPPRGTPVATGAVDDGKQAILEAARAYQPSVVLCGHTHGSPWLGSPFWHDPNFGVLFSNPGRRQTGVSLSRIDIIAGAEPTYEWIPHVG